MHGARFKGIITRLALEKLNEKQYKEILIVIEVNRNKDTNTNTLG